MTAGRETITRGPKLLADRQLRQRMEKGAPLVALYPGVVYGPGRMTDGNILAAAGRDLLRGRLPGTIGPGDRRQCLAFVEDVAAGFLLALDKAEPGSRYVLGGENLTVRQALELMARAGGVEVPRRVIPYSVAGWLGRILCWQAGWTGIEPPPESRRGGDLPPRMGLFVRAGPAGTGLHHHSGRRGSGADDALARGARPEPGGQLAGLRSG
ncbi:MAG: NAD-dependent epimerase/dehydratase family protein [Acidobacteriota bacterium]|nr:NAD-dependent epimerase/dehydratase family protein [Acidobacteriota bacterium]